MRVKVLWSAALMLVASPYIAQAATVKPVSASLLKKQIAAQRGKVVLVNFWATWCPPCVEEFPALSKLQKNYAAKNVAVIFVSADEAKTARTSVMPFLTKNRVASSWIVGGNASQFIQSFDPKLKGAFALPRTYVYNRSGKLSQVFSGGKSYAQFEKIVKTTK